MIDPGERSLERKDRCHVGGRAAGNHQHGNAEQPCRLDLGIGGASTAVLGNDAIDQVQLHEAQFGVKVKRPAFQDADDIRCEQRRIDGIDAAHKIEVLREEISPMRLLPADGQKYAAWYGSERGKGGRHIRYLVPMVAGNPLPGLAAEGKDRSARYRRGGSGVCGYLRGKGVGSIDHEIDGLSLQKRTQTFAAAKPAGANRSILGEGILRPSGQRQQHVDAIAFRQRLRQQPRLRRATQNKDASPAHV